MSSNGNAVLCVYALEKNVPCFDIYNALMRSEWERRELGYQFVDVEIVAGPNEGFGMKSLWPFTADGRRGMLGNVVLPMCGMLPSVRHVRHVPLERATPGRKHSTHTFAGFMRAYAKGIRPLRPRWHVQRNPRSVSITLREAEHWPSRNSKVEEWTRAAAHIAAMGFNVTVVRDTVHADARLPGAATPRVDTSPVCSRDLAHRAALYCGSVCNMFVNNGPAWFSLALDAPTIIMRPANEKSGKAASAETLIGLGITPDGMKGAPPHQRVVWQDDTTDNILAAFDTFMAREEAA